jgi:hypothetical protein
MRMIFGFACCCWAIADIFAAAAAVNPASSLGHLRRSHGSHRWGLRKLCLGRQVVKAAFVGLKAGMEPGSSIHAFPELGMGKLLALVSSRDRTRPVVVTGCWCTFGTDAAHHAPQPSPTASETFSVNARWKPPITRLWARKRRWDFPKPSKFESSATETAVFA